MSDKVTDGLSACPFCGATDCVKILKSSELNDEDFDPELDDESYAVNCDAQKGGCGAAGGFSVDVKKAVLKWNLRRSQPAPSPASVQSEVVVLAELVKIGGASWDNEKIQRAEAMIEADRDAQRQIGRDEVQEKAENIIVDLRKRYSTVVEAAKVYLKEHSCSDSHGICQDETNLRKALSDLDQSAPQDAKDN